MKLEIPKSSRHLSWMSLVALATALALAAACGRAPESANTPPSAVDPPEATAPIDTVPEVVRQMIAAHGGIEKWRSAPSVYFEDLWNSGANWSQIQVEQGNRRALLDYPGTPMRMAWNGELAWSVDWQAPAPPRFFALLNYYFVNLPWLTLDPGVVLEETAPTTLPDDPIEYRTVRMTFEDGVGDTPDDYYDLLIHPETHQLHGNRYIVTYRSILPEGVEHTPEHLLIYDEWATIDGLLVPMKFTIYEDGAVYATCEIRNWSFEKPFAEARLAIPEGAVIDESQP